MGAPGRIEGSRSSQIDASVCVVGEDATVRDAIPFHVVPNAKTMEEACRHDYSPPQIEGGRKVVTSEVEEFSIAES